MASLLALPVSKDTPTSTRDLLQPETWHYPGPPPMSVPTPSLIHRSLCLLTSPLIHQLPSTGTTSLKVPATATISLRGLRTWLPQPFFYLAGKDSEKHKSNITPQPKSPEDPPSLISSHLPFLLSSILAILTYFLASACLQGSSSNGEAGQRGLAQGVEFRSS